MTLGFYLLDCQICFMPGVNMSNVKLKVRTLFISFHSMQTNVMVRIPVTITAHA